MARYRIEVRLERTIIWRGVKYTKEKRLFVFISKDGVDNWLMFSCGKSNEGMYLNRRIWERLRVRIRAMIRAGEMLTQEEVEMWQRMTYEKFLEWLLGEDVEWVREDEK